MKAFAYFFFILSTTTFAQEKDPQTSTSVQLYFGRSFLGTGDVFGIEYGGIYSSAIGRKSFWFAEIGGSIHDGNWPLFYTTASGEWIDASIHYTTGGVQAVGGAGITLLKKSKHELAVRLGAVARYQSSSYWDEAAVYYPALTGLDIPVASFINTTPKRTMSLGGRGSFSYSYLFGKSLVVSVNASLQTDSNGDTLTSTTIGIGKKF